MGRNQENRSSGIYSVVTPQGALWVYGCRLNDWVVLDIEEFPAVELGAAAEESGTDFCVNFKTTEDVFMTRTMIPWKFENTYVEWDPKMSRRLSRVMSLNRTSTAIHRRSSPGPGGLDRHVTTSLDNTPVLMTIMLRKKSQEDQAAEASGGTKRKKAWYETELEGTISNFSYTEVEKDQASRIGEAFGTHIRNFKINGHNKQQRKVIESMVLKDEIQAAITSTSSSLEQKMESLTALSNRVVCAADPNLVLRLVGAFELMIPKKSKKMLISEILSEVLESQAGNIAHDDWDGLQEKQILAKLFRPFDSIIAFLHLWYSREQDLREGDSTHQGLSRIDTTTVPIDELQKDPKIYAQLRNGCRQLLQQGDEQKLIVTRYLTSRIRRAELRHRIYCYAREMFDAERGKYYQMLINTMREEVTKQETIRNRDQNIFPPESPNSKLDEKGWERAKNVIEVIQARKLKCLKEYELELELTNSFLKDVVQDDPEARACQRLAENHLSSASLKFQDDKEAYYGQVKRAWQYFEQGFEKSGNQDACCLFQHIQAKYMHLWKMKEDEANVNFAAHKDLETEILEALLPKLAYVLGMQSLHYNQNDGIRSKDLHEYTALFGKLLLGVLKEEWELAVQAAEQLNVKLKLDDMNTNLSFVLEFNAEQWTPEESDALFQFWEQNLDNLKHSNSAKNDPNFDALLWYMKYFLQPSRIMEAIDLFEKQFTHTGDATKTFWWEQKDRDSELVALAFDDEGYMCSIVIDQQRGELKLTRLKHKAALDSISNAAQHPLCGECQSAVSVLHCPECSTQLCLSCSTHLHNGVLPKRQQHNLRYFETDSRNHEKACHERVNLWNVVSVTGAQEKLTVRMLGRTQSTNLIFNNMGVREAFHSALSIVQMQADRKIPRLDAPHESEIADSGSGEVPIEWVSFKNLEECEDILVDATGGGASAWSGFNKLPKYRDGSKTLLMAKGAFGSVFVATHKRDGTDVAVKIILPEQDRLKKQQNSQRNTTDNELAANYGLKIQGSDQKVLEKLRVMIEQKKEAQKLLESLDDEEYAKTIGVLPKPHTVASSMLAADLCIFLVPFNTKQEIKSAKTMYQFSVLKKENRKTVPFDISCMVTKTAQLENGIYDISIFGEGAHGAGNPFPLKVQKATVGQGQNDYRDILHRQIVEEICEKHKLCQLFRTEILHMIQVVLEDVLVACKENSLDQIPGLAMGFRNLQNAEIPAPDLDHR